MVVPDGPIPAKIMIVGEAPGADEEIRGTPFVGVSGQELNRMLTEAGISRSECFTTNVCRTRPPKNDIFTYIALKKNQRTPHHSRIRGQHVLPPIVQGLELLRKEIQMVQPKVIVALGNVSLWALTSQWGITKWRGSQLNLDIDMGPPEILVIPTYHPAAILRQWDWRAIGVSDLRRVRGVRDGTVSPRPKWKFRIRSSYDQTISTLQELISLLDARVITRLSFDIETRAGHIACAGISWSHCDAICIPFMCVERRSGFWTLEQESCIVFYLVRILTHVYAEVVGQNILYDSQYTYRHWHFVPRVVQDTMIAQHSVFSALPKGLAFLASMYCKYYVYWKDEGKDWRKNMGEDQLWNYNCQDCVYTDEVGLALNETVKALGLESVYEFQQKMFWPVLQAMQRGVRIDLGRRDSLITEVHGEIDKRQSFLADVLGHPFNPQSPKQMHSLFYEDFKLPVQLKRGKKGEPSRPTLDDDAITKLASKEPLIRPITNAIADIRTLSKFLSNFLERPLDIDGRMRCAYNIGGSESGASAPKTYRLSSAENAFGSGTNLQNIPSEKSKSMGKAAARTGLSFIGDPYQFPNIREIFIPDPSYTFFDMDLERADLFVVCWEAEDEQLKTAMRLGVDIHLLNAYVVTNKSVPDLLELVETHPKYQDWRRPMKMIREFAKVFCHGTNYTGQPRTMAMHTGRSVQEIERAQNIWFGAHPGIKTWHQRVELQIRKYRFVENKFGYRWYIFDRIEQALAEAVAWIPQSTVSIVINKIWERIYRELPEVQILMQVHDSLPGQLPTARLLELLPRIQECAQITVPYEDPLVIPINIKTSEKSWGDC